MIRTCKKCGLVQLVEYFPKAATIKGKDYYRHLCNTCYVATKKPRKDKVRDLYFAFKKQFSCEKCGNDDFRVLDFDHLDRSKKSFNISNGLSHGYSIETLLAEAKKCQVLCSNCHRIKTFEERYLGVG